MTDLPCVSPSHVWISATAKGVKRFCVDCGLAEGGPSTGSKSKMVGKAKLLIERDGDTCHYCSIDLNNVNRSIDHKQPRSKGGTNALENLVLACRPCNGEKGDVPYAAYLAHRLSMRRT